MIAAVRANILVLMTSSKPATHAPGDQRNPGYAFRPDWLEGLQVDAAFAASRAAEVATRASADGRHDTEALLQVVRLLDLTTLTDGDTDETVRRLCASALQPVAPEILSALGVPQLTTAAVCVYGRFVPTARAALAGSGVRVAAVTGGFPFGHEAFGERLDDVRKAVEAGADEIDVVIDRNHALEGDWRALYDETRAFRDACGPARLKTILAAGDLGDLDVVARAGLVCCMGGADFIKTSTGREEVNATLPIGVAMIAALRCYADRAGHAVGLKPAGGIRTAKEALEWLQLMREEIGDAWTTARYFRLGASSLLRDINRQLEFRMDVVTGSVPCLPHPRRGSP